MNGTASRQRGLNRVEKSEEQADAAGSAISAAASRATAHSEAGSTREAGLLLRLTLLMTGLWVLAVGSGASMYSGRPPLKATLPLVGFDNVVRRGGPVLPAVVVALRLLAQLARPPATPAAMRPAASPPPLVVMGGLYLGVSAARAGLYVLHTLVAPLLVAPRAASGQAHVLSDHIFLGASLVAILTAEAHILAADMRCWSSGPKGLRQLCYRALIATAAAACALLFVAVAAEMHITARHFHAPPESFWAVVVGLVTFQLPVTLFMKRSST